MKATVGKQFSDSLKSLMEKLNSTTPHYVRCIKPNDEKAEFWCVFQSPRLKIFSIKFLKNRIVLLLLGLLNNYELVVFWKLSDFRPLDFLDDGLTKACLKNKIKNRKKNQQILNIIILNKCVSLFLKLLKDFRTRYRVLLRGKEPKMEPRKACESLLTRLIPDEDKYAFGKTKIFFRAGQVAIMEKWRIDRLNRCAVIIQKFIKMFIYRRQYIRMQQITLKLQSAAR